MTADDWMKEENEIRSHIAINRFLKKRRRKKKEEVLMKSHVFNHEIEGHKHLLSGFNLFLLPLFTTSPRILTFPFLI